MEQRNSKADDTNVYACNLLPLGNWDLFPWTFAVSNVKHSSKYLERNEQCRERLLEAEQLMGDLSSRPEGCPTLSGQQAWTPSGIPCQEVFGSSG